MSRLKLLDLYSPNMHTGLPNTYRFLSVHGVNRLASIRVRLGFGVRLELRLRPTGLHSFGCYVERKQIQCSAKLIWNLTACLLGCFKCRRCHGWSILIIPRTKKNRAETLKSSSPSQHPAQQRRVEAFRRREASLHFRHRDLVL